VRQRFAVILLLLSCFTSVLLADAVSVVNDPNVTDQEDTFDGDDVDPCIGPVRSKVGRHRSRKIGQAREMSNNDNSGHQRYFVPESLDSQIGYSSPSLNILQMVFRI